MYVEGRQGQLGPLVVAQEARQVVVVPRVVQLMAPGPGSGAAGSSTNGTGGSGAAGSSISSTGGSGAAVGSPVRRHPAYEQVEGPPLLESVE